MGFFGLPRDLKWLFLSNALWSFGSGLYQFTLPVYAAELGASPTQVGLLTAVGFLAATLLMVPSGWMADRWERRRAMLAAWLMGTASGPIYFLADRWEWLLAGIVCNWGSGYVVTVMQAYILDSDSTGRPGYTLSVIFAALPLGMVFSPYVGGLIAARWGARAVFAGATLFYVLSTACLFGLRPQRPRSPAAAGAAPGIGAELRAALTGWLHIRPAARRAILLAGLGEVVLVLTVALGQVYVVEVTGAGYAWVGWLGSLAALGAALFGPVLGRLAEQVSHRWALQVATVLHLIYAGVLLLAPGAPLPVTVAFFLRGAMEAVRPVLAAVAARWAEPGEERQALAFGNVTWGLYATLGSYLGGWLYEWHPALPLWVTVAAGLGYLAALRLGLGRG